MDENNCTESLAMFNKPASGLPTGNFEALLHCQLSSSLDFSLLCLEVGAAQHIRPLLCKSIALDAWHNLLKKRLYLTPHSSLIVLEARFIWHIQMHWHPTAFSPYISIYIDLTLLPQLPPLDKPTCQTAFSTAQLLLNNQSSYPSPFISMNTYVVMKAYHCTTPVLVVHEHLTQLDKHWRKSTL